MATVTGPQRIPHVYVVRPPNPTRHRRIPPLKYNRMMSAPASSNPATQPMNAKQRSKARENLHARLQQNWLRKNPENRPLPQADDSLTSLGWLQNLSVMKLSSNTPPSSPNEDELTETGSAPDSRCISPSGSFDPTVVNPNSILNLSHITNSSTVGPFIKQEPGTVSPSLCYDQDGSPYTGQNLDQVDYKTNACVKPPYSYATLICMAMRESNKNKITLSGIYKYITENFLYYRTAEPSWQNSIRHNLSLNKCFQKVARRKDEPGGKGGFWKISPQYDDTMVNGILMKRRTGRDMYGANNTMNGTSDTTGQRIKRENSIGLTEADFMNPDEDDEESDDVDVVRMYDGSSDSEIISSGYISRQETENAVYHLSGATAADEAEGHMGDFSWSEIMHRDIEVGGVSIKTEDLIDNDMEIPDSLKKCNSAPEQLNMDSLNISAGADIKGSATPITELSPPPSDNNSDLGVDDLLFTTSPHAEVTDAEMDSALDFLSGDPLDLTVSGTGLSKPEWWVDVPDLLKSLDHTSSRMSTPVMGSPDHHPWAESREYLDYNIDNFDCDFDNLFHLDDTTGSSST